MRSLQRSAGNQATARLMQFAAAAKSRQVQHLQRVGDEPSGPPEIPDILARCGVNVLDLSKFLDCCQKLAGDEVCAQEAIEAFCRIPGVRCAPQFLCKTGFRPGTGAFKGMCCQERGGASRETCCRPQQIANTRCCPENTIPDAATNQCIPPNPEVRCPPERVLPNGECCRPPKVIEGKDCRMPSVPPGPLPRPLPAPASLRIHFRQNKPALSTKGTHGIGESLTSEGRRALRALADRLKADPTLKVQLVGKASPEGDLRHNLMLGARRAEMIERALIDAGIDPSRFDHPAPDTFEHCPAIRPGIRTCGPFGASGPEDRQVEARTFTPAP
jgi:hypothetical protein